MQWNDHSVLKDTHAFLSPSNPSWHNYDHDKLGTVKENSKAAERGTLLHSLAAQHILLGIPMPRNNQTLNKYINDAIGFRMDPEVQLYYSKHCYGTADTIQYYEKQKLLRVHDLKTGVSPVHMIQLVTYAALFCLEYKFSPFDIDFELRIYQNDEIVVDNTDKSFVKEVMLDIVDKSRFLDTL